MPVRIEVDSRELAALAKENLGPAFKRAMSKSASTALRDMRSEAAKRVRLRKRIKAGIVRRSLVLRRPGSVRDIDGGVFGIDVRGGRQLALSAFPMRQTKKGVSVEVNRGKRSFIRSAFVATMTRAGGIRDSAVGTHGGHRGVYKRVGRERLPIREHLGSRPVDALLHEGEAAIVQERGRVSWQATFERLLPLELEKAAAKAKGGG